MKNENIKVIVIEDEVKLLAELSKMLTGFQNLEIVAKISDPLKAKSAVLEFRPDLIFLDVKMPVKSGFDILDELKDIYTQNFEVIFTTGYDEFALKAFDYAAFDFLLKPIDRTRLAESIMRFKTEKKKSLLQRANMLLGTMNKLVFKNISGAVFIDPEEVIFIEASGNYSVFHFSQNKTETVTCQLGEIELDLDKNYFFRTSRSYIINTKYLARINNRKRQCLLEKNDEKFNCEITRDKIKILTSRHEN